MKKKGEEKGRTLLEMKKREQKKERNEFGKKKRGEKRGDKYIMAQTISASNIQAQIEECHLHFNHQPTYHYEWQRKDKRRREIHKE